MHSLIDCEFSITVTLTPTFVTRKQPEDTVNGCGCAPVKLDSQKIGGSRMRFLRPKFLPSDLGSVSPPEMHKAGRERPLGELSA